MAISRASALANSYRFIRVMVDGYSGSKICGRIYHDSRNSGIQFKSLMNMVWVIEELLDEMQCPVRSTDIRRFKRTEYKINDSLRFSEYKEETQGKLMSFCLTVQHRQNASWQGQIRREDTQITQNFDSFLELTQILDSHLTKTELNWGLHKDYLEQTGYRHVCNIGIDDYLEGAASGGLYAKQVEAPLLFDSSIQMAKQLLTLLNDTDLLETPGKKLITHQSLRYYRKKGKKATFCIKILFRENCSLQGIMYWKERKEYTRFRSFLEMLMLIDVAVNESDNWQIAADKTVENVI